MHKHPRLFLTFSICMWTFCASKGELFQSLPLQHVHMYLVAFLVNLLNFYFQYSRSLFPPLLFRKHRRGHVGIRNFKGSSWDHTRGEYFGFLGTSVKDFSSYGIPVSTSMDLRENSSRISLCKYIFPDLELWNLRKSDQKKQKKTGVGETFSLNST